MTTNVEEILPGFYKIELPVPISALKCVFVYLLHDQHQNMLIDTGWAGEASYQALISAFDDLDFDLRDLKQLVISHLHPDHFGLASRLKKEARDVSLMMHADDARQIKTNKIQMRVFWRQLSDWLQKNGMPNNVVKEIVKSNQQLLGSNFPPLCDRKLRGEEKLRIGGFVLEVIHTPGHTRGSICLFDRRNRLLFSGDHVLPKITPNVSLSPSYKGNPLGEYLESLRRLGSLGTVLKVLPSHEYIFTDLPSRIGEIEEHHCGRLGDCLEAFRSGVDLDKGTLFSAYEIASKLKWHSGPWETLSPWGMRAAIMETAAHLEYLRNVGEIFRVEKKGKTCYRSAPNSFLA